MAKLYFYYSAMNAGKSTILLQSAHNYKERGMHTLLFTPSFDNRYAVGTITSRIGLSAPAISFDADTSLLQVVKQYQGQDQTKLTSIACILVDEAQFLTKQQVSDLTEIVDELNIPVLAYGLRTDFQGNPFEGSLYLLLWADNLVEIKTICHCGKKAVMNARIDAQQQMVKTGEQIQIGGNEQYIALCRKHYKQGKT